MNVKELKAIESKFLELAGYPIKNELGRYNVFTDAGIWEVSFQYEGLASIFTRFDDVCTAKMRVHCNPYSGKYNFHGDNCIWFLRDIEAKRINLILEKVI